VDTVVSEGGISHVVPLLTFFPAPGSDSKDRRQYLVAMLSLNAEHVYVADAL
jgi:hypothetical protein